jgi:hypothetical protein
MDKGGPKLIILGAGRVCQPAAEFLAASPNTYACGANDKITQVKFLLLWHLCIKKIQRR